MELIHGKLKKWGNSFGLVVPVEVVNKNNLKENSDVVYSLQSSKVSTGKDLMNLGKNLGLDKKLKNLDTQEALRKIDEVFSSD
jgi:antitoxin component of MazEF toxin-antitoxin module